MNFSDKQIIYIHETIIAKSTRVLNLLEVSTMCYVFDMHFMVSSRCTLR
jgi:hypothetical protein